MFDLTIYHLTLPLRDRSDVIKQIALAIPYPDLSRWDKATLIAM